MATKNVVFSDFTVESLLSTDRCSGRKDNSRQQASQQDSKSSESDLLQTLCADNRDLNLDDYIAEDGSLKHSQTSHLKWRRNRTIFNSAQLKTLEGTFHRQKYLSVGVRGKLARSLGLSEDQVKTWFQNRRTKFKKNVCVRPRSIIIPSSPELLPQNYPQYPCYKTTEAPACPGLPSNVHKCTKTIHSYRLPVSSNNFSCDEIWNQFCPPV